MFRDRLRAETAADHESVDGAFSRFSLAESTSYRKFLEAHARVLIPVERWLGDYHVLPGWNGRSAALSADFVGLAGHVREGAFQPPGQDAAAVWGALYVVEGSRLGGRMLLRSVAAGLPSAYLGSFHPPGAWRQLLDGIDEAAAAGGPAWERTAIISARSVFKAFRDAAGAATDD